MFGSIASFFSSALVASLIAIGINYWMSCHQKKIEVLGCLQAVRDEAVFCNKMANEYLKEENPISSPLWRLPTEAWKTAAPVLVRSGVYKEDTTSQALIEFYNYVESLNRGLDQIHASRGSNNFRGEYNRNRLKAKHILDSYATVTKTLEDLEVKFSKWGLF